MQRLKCKYLFEDFDQSPDTKYIFINVGLNTFLELTMDEALKVIEKKEKLLNSRVEKLTQTINELKAQIQM